MYSKNEILGFSVEELKQLLISALAITFIFIYPTFRSPDWWIAFIFYFIFIGLGFLVHESSHKFMAKARGAWSEFRMWRDGLVFSLLIRVVGGPVFLAPGATMWAKPRASIEDHGIVSVVGPVSNIVLAGLFFAGSFFVPVLAIGSFVNLQLAMFNLLPIPPLDGSKVIKWNPIIWGVLFFSSLLLPRII